MSALANARNTSELADRSKELVIPVEAATIIYAGSLVAINRNGRAVPAQVYGSSPVDLLKVVGRCEGVHNGIPGASATNVSGGSCPPAIDSALGTAGAISVRVRRGVFFYDINASSIVQANVGDLCFAVDDHTVDLSDNSAARPCAGRIMAVGDPAFPGMCAVDTFDHAATATSAGH